MVSQTSRHIVKNGHMNLLLIVQGEPKVLNENQFQNLKMILQLLDHHVVKIDSFTALMD